MFNRKIILTIFLLILISGTGFMTYYFLLKPLSITYEKGLSLLADGSYQEAQSVFNNLGNYKSSKQKNEEISSYLYADELIANEDYESAIKFLNSITNTIHTKKRFKLIYDTAIQLKANGNYNMALPIFLRLKDYEDSRQYANQLIKLIDERHQVTLSSGYRHFVSLSSKGIVTALGDNSYGQCNTTSWSNIEKIYAEGNYTVGIKNDGSIIITGDIAPEGESITSWTNIKEISLFPYPNLYKAIGLKNDGTIISTSSDSPACLWTNIKHITASSNHLIGLKSNGTLVAVGSNDKGQCNISEWTHITYVIAGNGYTLGLKDNGTILIAGDLTSRNNITNWSNICHLWSSDTITVGLRKDGTLIATGPNINSNTLSSWKNICQIAVNTNGIIGLQLNASLVSFGLNDLSSFDELSNIHIGSYLFGAVKNNDSLVTKELIPPPSAEDFEIRIEPTLGMTPDEVKKSTWGLPDKIISIIDSEGAHQQWIYGNNSITFLDSIVVSIQQEETSVK